MKITAKEKEVLRNLAGKYAELAALPVQKERYERGRDINDLKPRRPMVWLDEIPWHEMDICGNLALVCEDEFARQMEQHFRRTLYRWEHIQGDMVVENVYNIPKHFTSTGIGIEAKEDLLITDDRNYIMSHAYHDQIDTWEKAGAITDPVLTAHPEVDNQRAEWANDILDGILPVRLQGHYIYHAPWDNIPRYRGVTNVLADLAFEPEFTHAIIKKFTDGAFSSMKQMEKLGLLDSEISNLHCTPPYVTDFEQSANPATMKTSWFRGMAQLFTEVSPQMFKEFELDYVKPIMAEFGLVYYGCCEALDDKIQLLKSIPNLRKIGISPWANPEKCAEQIGGDYVYAHKPNPAYVSGTFDADVVRQEIKRVIDTCHKHNCPYEFVIKDISTVGNKPQNLIDWTKTVKEVIDSYY